MSKYYRWLDRMQAMERKFHSSRVNLLLLLLVVFLLGGFCFSVALPYFKIKATDSIQSVKGEGAAAQVLAQKLAARELELSMAIKSHDDMKALFEEQHNKHKSLTRELAFYRSIMTPESNADGVVINGLVLSPDLVADSYRLKLVLTQLQNKKQALAGQAHVTFVGLLKGKATELKLSDLSQDPFRFRFRYFQILETSVTLPSDFVLSRVKVKVKVTKGRRAKGEETEKEYTLAQLQLAEKEAAAVLDQNGQALDN